MPPCLRRIFILAAQRVGFKIPGVALGKLERVRLRELDDANRKELFGHLASVEEIVPEIHGALLAQSSSNLAELKISLPRTFMLITLALNLVLLLIGIAFLSLLFHGRAVVGPTISAGMGGATGGYAFVDREHLHFGVNLGVSFGGGRYRGSSAGLLAAVEPGELADFLPAHLRPAYDPLDGSGTLFTDPLLLGTLVGQAERVLSYACPGCLPSFRLAFDPGSGQGVITAEAERPANRSPQVARTGGSAPGQENADWDQAEFRNLARLMISPQLLQALGIRVRVSTPSGDCFRLSCELPLVETPATAPPENMPVV